VLQEQNDSAMPDARASEAAYIALLLQANPAENLRALSFQVELISQAFRKCIKLGFFRGGARRVPRGLRHKWRRKITVRCRSRAGPYGGESISSAPDAKILLTGYK
jgi:hypothetical protein